MHRAFLAALAALLLVVASPATGSADAALDNGGLRWNTHGTAPTIVLLPVGMSQLELDGVQYAASQWNDTGYVRFFVAPPVATYPKWCDRGGNPPCVPVVDDPALGTGAGTSLTVTGGGKFISGAVTYIGSGVFYTKQITTHELGHVLGLGHTSVVSIMNQWGVGCPTPLDVEALAKKYAPASGTAVVPVGYIYPAGIPCERLG